jgi:hypothetical protein
MTTSPWSSLLQNINCSPTHVFFREQRKQKICQALLDMIPGLQECLTTGSEDEVVVIAELVSSLHGAQLD